MTSIDRRHHDARSPINKAQFATITVSNAQGTTEQTQDFANVNMLIESIDVLTNAWTNSVTTSITLVDENGVDMLGGSTITGIDKSSADTFLATKATPDFPARPATGTLTAGATMSGAVGATGAEIQVILRGP